MKRATLVALVFLAVQAVPALLALAIEMGRLAR